MEGDEVEQFVGDTQQKICLRKFAHQRLEEKTRGF
jgi:hypothetical protein